MIEKLLEKNPALRNNIIISLSNIAEFPEGFLKITEEMADQIDLLDEVRFVFLIIMNYYRYLDQI